MKPVVRQCGGRWARYRCWRRAPTWGSAWSPARAPGTAPSCPRQRGTPSPSPGRTDLWGKTVFVMDDGTLMSSLLVSIRVYRLEIQSAMLVFSTPLVNCCPSTFSLTYGVLTYGEKQCCHGQRSPKCRLYWCSRIYRLEIQSVMLVFSTPSCELAPL